MFGQVSADIPPARKAKMKIEEAVESLRQQLANDDVFQVRVVEGRIVVDVAFIYPINEVPREWEGYPVSIGRRSCW